MKISIIGAGAMGGAMARGLALSKSLQPSDITVSDPNDEALSALKDSGVKATKDNIEAVKSSDIVILAVKPWLTEKIVCQIKSELDYSKQTLISICAGVSSKDLISWLEKGDGKLPEIFLVIPNIAMAIKESTTFVVPINAKKETVDEVLHLFSQTGSAIRIEEKLLPAATTLASCGIAYAARYIRASIEGGIELGFKEQEARKAVLQTVLGAVNLIKESGLHPEAMIDKVCTPGGMTIRGLNQMEHSGFTSAVIKGLKAGIK